MSIAKIIEMSSESSISFQDAIETGIRRAEQTLDHVKGAWIDGQKVRVENGKIVAYRVNLRLSFMLEPVVG